MGEFVKWAKLRQRKPGAAPERDWALASCGAELYFSGASAADFSKTRAAAAFAWTDAPKGGVELKKAFPRRSFS